jgi:hypothetical protein
MTKTGYVLRRIYTILLNELCRKKTMAEKYILLKELRCLIFLGMASKTTPRFTAIASDHFAVIPPEHVGIGTSMGSMT